MVDSHIPLPQADPRSLPYCLRHMSKEDALDDARKLSALLRDIIFYAEALDEAPMEGKSRGGLQLVCDLLTDKLDIAAGQYLFPCFHAGCDIELAERKED